VRRKELLEENKYLVVVIPTNSATMSLVGYALYEEESPE